jgi:NADH-quinone oxidoreductase subunit G
MKVEIEIDGRTVTVEAGRDLLSTCMEQGVEVPHFCWHEALGSVGACRLCAVMVQDAQGEAAGRVEMACMTAVAAGQRISVDEPQAADFRARVIEWLMVNHPHDCAVCEAGGACQLQDMTVLSGHHARRFRFRKRTHRNQYLGPFLTHDMNRCIACYRCTRFYRGYAGGRDLDVFGSGERVYFGRAADGVLESPFAGNLAEICPTGVFNDKAWSEHYARPWDMRVTPSICPHCAVGCNLTLAERHGSLRRVENRYHGAINGSFLCDRGRFGPLFVEGSSRLEFPTYQGQIIELQAAMALATAAVAGGAIGVGSVRASLEANLALRRLVGPRHFFVGVSDAEAVLVRRMAALLRAGPARIATLRDIETADAALVLGEDLTGTAPRAALALRQAARGAEKALAAAKGVPAWLDEAVRVAGEGRRSPIVLVTALPDALDEVATRSLRRSPGAIAAFGGAVAAVLRGEPSADADATATAQMLATAQAPVVIAGIGLLEPAIVEAAASVAAALGARAALALFPPECNSLGCALMGGGGLDSAVAALEAAGERAPAAILLEADLYARAAPALVDRLFAAADMTIALDCIVTRTTARADVVLPVASFAEAAGTTVNHEGRAQRGFAARPGSSPASWRLLPALRHGVFAVDAPVLDDVLVALAQDCPDLAAAASAAPHADFTTPLGRVARAPAPFSGRTASDEAGRTFLGTPPSDPDSPLSWTMEGAHGTSVPPALSTGAHSPGQHSPGQHSPGQHSPGGSWRRQARTGGPLPGGDPGAPVLLVGVRARDEAGALAPVAVHAQALEAPGLLLIPSYDSFIATEIDQASPLLAERAPHPKLVLHPADAALLGLRENADATLDGLRFAARVSLDERLPRGIASVSNAMLEPRRTPRRAKLGPA